MLGETEVTVASLFTLRNVLTSGGDGSGVEVVLSIAGHQDALVGEPATIVVNLTQDVNVAVVRLGTRNFRPLTSDGELVGLQVDGNGPFTCGQCDSLAVVGQSTLNAQQFLSHQEVAVANGTNAVGSDSIPVGSAVSELLGETEVTHAVVLTSGGDVGGVNTLVQGHQDTLVGEPATVVIHLTDDVKVSLGLGSNGVGRPLTSDGELVGLQVDGNGPFACGHCDSLAVIGQSTLNAQQLLGHQEVALADGTDAVGSDGIPVGSAVGELLGEAEVADAFVLTSGGDVGGVNAFVQGHLDTLVGEPATIVIHLTDDVKISGGLGSNGVGGPGTVDGELVGVQVDGNGPFTLGDSDGVVAAICS